MKRGASSFDHDAKRLILGVERLSLNGPRPLPVPSPAHSLEVLVHDDSSSNSGHSGKPSSSSGGSDSEHEAKVRERAASESQHATANSNDMEVEKRERSWSLPRIVQLREEEARVTTSTSLVTVLSRMPRPRLLRRRASDPARLKDRENKATGGYSAGCECDSDAEDEWRCKHCRRKKSEASL